jgi:predicted transcriptional regulator of viral defense system
MKINELNKINKLYFSYEDVAKALNISEKAAMVTCSRYVKHGSLLRIKRNIYVNKNRWDFLDDDEIYRIANIIQVPSYISLTTAISYYGLTTQVQRNFYESIVLNRTNEIEISKKIFSYSKVQKDLYFGFKKKESFL